MLGGWVFTAFAFCRAVSFTLIIAGAVTLIGFGPALDWGHNFGAPLDAPATGLAFAAVIVGFGNLERLGVLRFGRMARRLGAMSYPLYILHSPLIVIVEEQCGGWRLDNRAVYGLAFAGLVSLYGISALAAFGVDQPLQRWLRRRVRPLARFSFRTPATLSLPE